MSKFLFSWGEVAIVCLLIYSTSILDNASFMMVHTCLNIIHKLSWNTYLIMVKQISVHLLAFCHVINFMTLFCNNIWWSRHWIYFFQTIIWNKYNAHLSFAGNVGQTWYGMLSPWIKHAAKTQVHNCQVVWKSTQL